MKSNEIRNRFFTFFEKHNHTVVPSSSLIPAQDPTLLFTNAGMNQFKDIFLGTESRSYTRAVSIQKCVRAGGKHNDLDNVGFTKRHLTFFEMMGNFSFGDYFKKEAIQYAWDFLTKELAIGTDRLHATVFETDDESYNLWHTMIGIPQDRIHRLGKKDNFWSMGDSGPCGPCTEIHLDRGAGADPNCPNPAACGPACDCDRFLEIWNVVFMQYDQLPSGLTDLKKKGVDTGMGLERLCTVLQNVSSVYETDLFTPLIAAVQQVTGIVYREQNDTTKAAFHVLADHARCATMLIADGCTPSNDGRGYVLRKIIRRAALFTQKLSNDATIFANLSTTVIEQLAPHYPAIKNQATLVHEVLLSEITKFIANLSRGTTFLTNYIKQNSTHKIVTGKHAFTMYDTYGFPLELTELIAREAGFTVDTREFETLMTEQKERSGKKVSDPLEELELPESVTSEFTGYQELETSGTIVALVSNNAVVSEIPAEHECYLITDRSPFFVVGGGQVPDTGVLVIGHHTVPVTHVRFINKRIALQIKAPCHLKTGMKITSIVDKKWRTAAMNNHTATHLLQAALVQVLGNHIKQAGSLVHPDYLRFDFNYHQALSQAQIDQVENIVNEKIRENIPVSVAYLPMKEALHKGALAFFGDKYNPEEVRMVSVGAFSIELCGGTHVPATGVIGAFKITDSTSPAAGQRRIFAVTGATACTLFQQSYATCKRVSTELKVPFDHLSTGVVRLKDEARALNLENKNLKKEILNLTLPALIKKAADRNLGIKTLYFPKLMGTELKELIDQCQQHTKGTYAIVGTDTDSHKTTFAIAIGQDTGTQKLTEYVERIKTSFGLKAGGNQRYIQGSGDIKPEILIKDIETYFTN